MCDPAAHRTASGPRRGRYTNTARTNHHAEQQARRPGRGQRHGGNARRPRAKGGQQSQSVVNRRWRPRVYPPFGAVILSSAWPLLVSPKGRYGASQWARAAVSPAAPSALRPGCLGGQRDLGDIGVAGEEDQLAAARIGEDGQRLIRTACQTRTGRSAASGVAFVASRPRPPGLAGPAACAGETGGVSRGGEGLVSQP
jgi:hypothetical protein